MFPTDVGESKSEYVSEVVKFVKQSGYPYQLTPMATIVELKSMDEALGLIKDCYEVLEAKDCNRIYSVLKFDIRKNKSNRLVEKIKSVEKKLKRIRQLKREADKLPYIERVNRTAELQEKERILVMEYNKLHETLRGKN